MTAVEWLSKRTFIPLQLLDQAKAMEREQINEAFYDGEENAHKYKSSPALYYNETFKQK